MILVDAHGLTATRPDRPLFSDVSVTIASGDRLAVVGVNGTGKSTLLGALAGSRVPEAGAIRRGSGARLSHLDQDRPLPAGTVASVSGDGWEAAAVRDRLGLAGLDERRTDQLSGGQVKRVALARALLACGPPGGGPADEADLLILDEPTNHLDVDAIAWLEEWLAGFRGGLVLVTHDRHVLDRVTTRILELDRGGTYAHDGGYSSYLEAKADREERTATAEQKRRNLAREELRWLRRGAPARSSKPRARLEAAEALVEGPDATQDARAGALDLHLATPRLGDKVLEAHGVGARVGDRWLFRDLDLLLDNRERLGIVGPNGAGKTTLLRILAGTREPDAGRLDVGTTVRRAAFTQDAAELEGSARVRDLVTGGQKNPPWTVTALMERFWFDDDAQWAPVSTLSGGERRRLQLLLTLRTEPNVLLLDEPTNDLDLETLRILEDFLDDWPGALIVVSHDRALLERTVTDVLVIDDGTAGRRAGGLGAWLEERRSRRPRRGKATVEPTTSKQSRPSPPATPPRDTPSKAAGSSAASGRSPSTLRFQFNKAERELAKATEERDALAVAMAEAGADHARLTELAPALAAAEARVEDAEAAWLELAEEVEAVNPGLL